MKRFDRQDLRSVWLAVRMLFDPERIRRALTRNLPLKLLSLLIASGLWFFVNFGERDTEESLQVPLELRNIPAALMITNPRVEFIDLRVSGPRTLLGRIDRNRLTMALDLNGVRFGSSVFRIDVESLSLPRGVKIVRINPAQVTLDLDNIARKRVPVQVQTTGLSPDLRAKSSASPENIEVIGPASDIDDIRAVDTEVVDLTGVAATTLQRNLGLQPAGDYVSFSTDRVAAQIRIEEEMVTREFKRITITVRDAAHPYRLTPQVVRLTVRGPKHLVENLEIDHDAVYIDAKGEEPGERMVEPAIELPAGITLVSADPPKVQLALLKGKRNRGHR